jgi:hypothetical protein
MFGSLVAMTGTWSNFDECCILTKCHTKIEPQLEENMEHDEIALLSVTVLKFY